MSQPLPRDGLGVCLGGGTSPMTLASSDRQV